MEGALRMEEARPSLACMTQDTWTDAGRRGGRLEHDRHSERVRAQGDVEGGPHLALADAQDPEGGATVLGLDPRVRKREGSVEHLDVEHQHGLSTAAHLAGPSGGEGERAGSGAAFHEHRPTGSQTSVERAIDDRPSARDGVDAA